MVNDMLTSEIATISTDVECRSSASNTERRKPCTITPREATTFTMLMPIFAVIARNVSLPGGACAVIFVPVLFRLREFST